MKIVICTLYFPPSNTTPANRTLSWAMYLSTFGIYPIIITRQWPPLTNYLYEEKAVGDKVIIEKYPGYEVHYLPFKGNYRTRSLEKHGTERNKNLRRVFLVLEIFLKNIFQSLLPYKNIFNYSLAFVKNNPVDKILITGSPFQLFKIGYLAKKKYNIPWVADYRDGWTIGNHNYTAGFLGKIEKKADNFFERKWISSAESFTTVSPYLKNVLESSLKKKGNIVYNGFFNEDIKEINNSSKNTLRIVYSGSIYASQDYPTFVEVLLRLIKKYQSKILIEVIFVGSTYKNDYFKDFDGFKGNEQNFILMERTSYLQSLHINATADIFLMLSYQGTKGIASSKLFDYIKYKKPVILFPNDNDILDEILQTSGLGVIATNAKELEVKIEALIKEKIAAGYIDINPDEEYINSFSRENQTGKLAGILKMV